MVSFTDKDKEELKRQLKGKKGGKVTMEIFRLKGRPNYHISDASGMYSYCNNARRYKLSSMGEDMRMYEEVDGVDTKNYTGEEKLCQTCVAKAYQNGKITVIPIEDEEVTEEIEIEDKEVQDEKLEDEELEDEELEVLAYVGDIEVLASRFGIDWLDPVLTMRFNEKELRLNTDAGEFDNDFGEFVISTDRFTDTELAMVKEVLDEIADEASIMEFNNFGFTKFALNQKYLEELEELEELEDEKLEDEKLEDEELEELEELEDEELE